jgi:hypothetical protein
MRIDRPLTLLALIVVAVMGLPAVAHAATASITGLTSSTHPSGQWTSSANPSFAWDRTIDWAPSLLGGYNTPGSSWGIAVSGTTAYLADGSAGLQIVDISDRKNPVLLGAYNTPGNAWSVAVSGATAYVADGSAGLQVIDVTNPTAPSLRGTYDTPGAGYFVAVSGTTAYVADGSAGLQVIDVSVPTAPVLRGTCATGGSAEGVAVSGTTAYVAALTAGLKVIDVSVPAAPVLRGTYDTPGRADGVAVSGTTAYVADYTSGLQIIDVSTATAPALLGSYAAPNRAFGVAVSGGYAYVGDHGQGLVVVDVSNPAAPTAFGSLATGTNFTPGVAVSGATAYLAADDSGLLAADVTSPAWGTPAVSYSYELSGEPGTIPDAVADGSAPSTALSGVGDGLSYFHVRTIMRGVAGTTSHVAVRIDTTPPEASDDAPRWASSDVSATVAASDGQSGVGGMNWLVTDPGGATSTGATATGSRTLPVSELGTTTIEYSAVDVAGNRCATETAVMCIEKDPPSIEIVASPSAVASGPVSVSFVASDAVSGVDEVRYRVDGGALQNDTSLPFDISVAGRHVVEAFVADKAGNTSNTTAFITISATAPTVTCDAPDGWAKTDTAVRLSATDADSSIAGIDWTITNPDGSTATGSAATDTAEITVAAEGTTIIAYSALNAAGTRCATETATVRIDRGAPHVALEDLSTSEYLAKFAVGGTDTLSGVGSVSWRIGEEETQTANGARAIVTYGVPGTHSIAAWSTDAAGNRSAPTSRTFTVTGPSEIRRSSGSATLPRYDAAFTLAGTFISGGMPTGGVRVLLESSSDGVGFRTQSIATTTAADGTFALKVVPRVKTVYRARAVASPGVAGVVGPAVYALPRALVGTPAARAKMRVGRGYRVTGSLKPRHTAGALAVRVYQWRWVNGRWKSYGYRNAKVYKYSTHSKYGTVIRFKKAGKWRIRAYHADSGHAVSWSSGYRYIRVR